MNGALVVILALLWALVLLPGALRSRRSSPASSVGTFERAMDVLARREQTPGRYVYVPRDAGVIVGDRMRRRRAMLDRRRRAFTRLLIGVAVAFLAGVLGGGRWWFLAVAGVGALITYVALLLRWKAQAEQAAEVVRELPTTLVVPEDLDHDQALFAHDLVAVGAEHRGVVGGAEHRADPRFGEVQVATHRDEPWAPQAGVRIRRWED